MVTKKKVQKELVESVIEQVEKPVHKLTQAQNIWNTIKDIDLELFSIPNQYIEQYLQPVFEFSKDELFVLLKTQIVVAVIDEKIKPFNLKTRQEDKFLVIFK